MKVVFDMALIELVGQSGIGRVTKNLSLQLAKAPECELSFCASLPTVEHWLEVYKYLKKSELLDPKLLIKFQNSIINKKGILLKTIESLDNLHQWGFAGAKSFKKIIINTLLSNFDPLPQQELVDKQIYHSSFFAIPKKIQTMKHLQKVLTFHDLIPILFPQYVHEAIINNFEEILNSIHQETWLICVSESAKNDLCNHLSFIDSQRVHVIYSAASENFYPCQNRETIEAVKKKYKIPNNPYILALNNLEPRKNIEQLIRCFASLCQQEKLKDLSLVLAGSKGWLYNNIFTEIDKITELKERIIVTGYVDDVDLAALYSGAMMFVFPSLYEGFGLPPLEAMQCGTPVITSNTSSLPEVVGDAGIMIHPQDSDGLCQSILDLYHDSSLREKLSHQSIERAKLFSWEQCAKNVINLYQIAVGC
ncbi:glycosyl transferase group 1 (plasmid) [Gloeothece citriformis PCC 7424]|uniref:Glycosyl transferase group 1 n=1 Tax=Gloeothece citriformis (strain PCC 7424) TaxID=65393 RepID=B7KM95_GLOC7|nr:glycosyltransferase family 1 protein [Gloeothece citriformis]ACK73917.1 glycosyl transferase group 1 [Gloeothece citriformis PCC 7424]